MRAKKAYLHPNALKNPSLENQDIHRRCCSVKALHLANRKMGFGKNGKQHFQN
jgi:hypothetical protein